ncbi:MAG: 8-amino-7-oxononanoate synthase, partial [Acidimicrobiia bacterium]
MTSLERTSPTAWIGAELASLKEQSLLRVSYEIEHRFGCEISLGGRKLLLAASNDYLGLSTDPRVREAAADAARRWGGGSSASPLVSGYSELQSQLESEIASFKGCDDCVVFSSGYLANIGTITALVGKGDVVFSDELNHASIIDGCRLSGAEIRIFRHSDPE